MLRKVKPRFVVHLTINLFLSCMEAIFISDILVYILAKWPELQNVTYMADISL